MNGRDLAIPGSPFPPKVMGGACRRLRGIGGIVAGAFPKLGEQLRQANMGVAKEEYGAAILVTSAFYFFLAFAAVLAIGAIAADTNPKEVKASDVPVAAVVVGLLAAGMSGAQVALAPRMRLARKVRDLERNLVFALRTILVEVRSGVTLFDAIGIAANGENGQVSVEFRKAIDRINTGKYQNDALEEMAENNPSLYFRRAIWQLVNGLKAGADISVVMEALVQGLSAEKANQVRKYGNSLKLLSLLYMMLGAIMPAMGVTMLIILSTFPQVKIGEEIFWGMLLMLLVMQFMFIGVIKNTRPSLLGD